MKFFYSFLFSTLTFTAIAQDLTSIDNIEWVLEPNFERIRILSDRFLNIHDTLKNSFIYDFEKEELIPTEYLLIEPVEYLGDNTPLYYSAYIDDSNIEKVGGFWDNLKRVLLDENLEEVVDLDLNRVKFCNGQFCLAMTKETKDVIIDTKVKSVTNLPDNIFTASVDFSNSNFIAGKSENNSFPGKMYLIDYKGEIINSFPDEIYLSGGENEYFSEYFSRGSGTLQNGIISNKGEIIVKPEEDARVFEEKNYVIFQRDRGQSILLNSEGIVNLGDEIFNIEPFNEKNVLVQNKQNKVGLSDYNGKIVIPLDYEKIGFKNSDKLSEYNQFFLFANKKGASIYFDRAIKNIKQTPFDAIGTTCERLLAVKKNNKWGVVDKTNEVILDFGYSPYKISYHYINPYVYEDCPIVFIKKNNSYFIGVFEGDFFTLFKENGEKIIRFNFIDKKTDFYITFPTDEEIFTTLVMRPMPSYHSKFRTKIKLKGEVLDSLQKSSNGKLFKDNEIFIATVGDGRKEKAGLINAKQEWVLLPENISITSLRNGFYRVRKNKKNSGVVRIRN